MTTKSTLGFSINDQHLIDTVRQVCDKEGLSYRAFAEAMTREVLANPDHFAHAVAEAKKLMSVNSSEIGRLHAENLALRQRIAELERLHPGSINIQPPAERVGRFS